MSDTNAPEPEANPEKVDVTFEPTPEAQPHDDPNNPDAEPQTGGTH
jgi:hypothetical protein